MKKTMIFLGLILLMMSLAACGGTPAEQDEQPPADLQEADPNAQGDTGEEVLEPEADPGPDYSFSTTMPDGSERVEATYLRKVDKNTLLVKGIDGERNIKASATVLEHLDKLKIEENDIVIFILRNGVAESIEKVMN